MSIYLEPYHKLEHSKPNKNGYYLLHAKAHALKLVKIHTNSYPFSNDFQERMTYNAQSRSSIFIVKSTRIFYATIGYL
jgi:hypothetical protein